MCLPLLVGGVCVITSIIGTYMVRLGEKQSIMGALYKGFWTAAGLAVPAVYVVTNYALGDMNTVVGGAAGSGRLRGDTQVVATAVGGAVTGMDLFWCMLVGLGLTGAARLDHRILHRHQLSPGPVDRQGVGNRPRHQRHPGPRRQPRIARAADAGDRHRGDRLLPVCRGARRRDGRDRDARACGHGRRAGRLRSGHRQCRRDRRNGRAGRRRARAHRCAGRGRQHHQGGDQGLCDRFGGACRAGAVRRLHHRPHRISPASRSISR